MQNMGHIHLHWERDKIHHKATQHSTLGIAFLTKNAIKQNLKRKIMPIPCTGVLITP
jgi:hypothetical protein